MLKNKLPIHAKALEDKTKKMETADKYYRKSRAGKVFAGLLVVAAGVLLFMRQTGTAFPEWVFTWKTLLIAFGLFIGFKHGLRNTGWLVPVIIGGVFLIGDFLPGMNFRHLMLPVIVIVTGLFIMFRPYRSRRCYPGHHRWKGRWGNYEWKEHAEQECFAASEMTSEEDVLESVTVFGGIKKNILSKNFKGGNITAFFGGAEINLSQADMTVKAILDVTAVFGGIKLIVPAHWEVKSEITAVLGGVEDKRPLTAGAAASGKILVLRGTAVFGGIEIKSF